MLPNASEMVKTEWKLATMQPTDFRTHTTNTLQFGIALTKSRTHMRVDLSPATPEIHTNAPAKVNSPAGNSKEAPAKLNSRRRGTTEQEEQK